MRKFLIRFHLYIRSNKVLIELLQLISYPRKKRLDLRKVDSRDLI